MSDVFWIEGFPYSPAARLAIVMRPQGDMLQDEILRMKDAGIRTVVSMLEDWEADYLGLADERRIAERSGVSFISYPIRDGSIPADKAGFRRFADELAARVRRGDAIGIHCRGCIGRATIAAACTLIHLGWDARAALRAIESTRGCSVPDTEEQRNWILRYEAEP